MSFLLPEAGLLFWMLLSFGILFFVLYKYGFPVIVSMIEARKKFIDEALTNAKEANERLKGVEAESRMILEKANEEQGRIIREAVATKEQRVSDAKKTAENEASRLLLEARETIRNEKEDALRELRGQVAELSIAIAGKVLRDKLSDGALEKEYINKLLDEALTEKESKK